MCDCLKYAVACYCLLKVETQNLTHRLGNLQNIVGGESDLKGKGEVETNTQSVFV